MNTRIAVVILALAVLLAAASIAAGQGGGGDRQQWEYLAFAYIHQEGSETAVTGNAEYDALLDCARGCDAQGIEHYLNLLGNEGWEMVGFRVDAGSAQSSTIAYFKRPA